MQHAVTVNARKRTLALFVGRAMPRGMIRLSAAIALTVSALSLAACASDAAEYPSLARRPVERVTGEAPVVTPTPIATTPADPALAGTLDSLVAQARAADRRFAERESRARSLVGAAGGAAVASEAWSVATIALADLESARSDAMIAMAQLDTLLASAKIETQETAAISAAHDTVGAIIARQDSIIANLHSRLR